MSEFLISKTLLRSFIPLSGLSDEQLDWLLSQTEQRYYFKGQVLFDELSLKQQYVYLIHGSVREISDSGEQVIEAGSKAASHSLTRYFEQKTRVLAEADCGVLIIPTQDVEKLLCWSQVARCLLSELAIKEEYQQDYFWIQKLLQSKLFYKVPPMNIQKILSRFKEQKVSAGENIITQGEEGRCCYLLKLGRASVNINGENIATLEAGTVFGEDALVNNALRSASVDMLEDGLLLRLEKQDFYQLLVQPAVNMLPVGNLIGFVESGAVLLDVRTENEYNQAHAKGALNMPLNLCLLKAALLDKEKLYIVYAMTEERAKAGAYLLASLGFQAYALQSGAGASFAALGEQFVVCGS